MMTTELGSRSARVLAVGINDLMREFKRAQDKVKLRFEQIQRGELLRKRTATRVLLGQRDRKRQACIDFLDDLSEDEHNVLTVAYGTRHWRDEYDRHLDPANDPQL